MFSKHTILFQHLWHLSCENSVNNSLTPGSCDWNFKSMFYLKHLVSDILSTYQAVALSRMKLDMFSSNFVVSWFLIISHKQYDIIWNRWWDAVKSHGTSIINTLRPRQNGRHFTNDIFRGIFVYERFCILIKISLKFVPKGPIDNNSALVKIMTWHQIGNKPLSEPMLTRFTDAYMWH